VKDPNFALVFKDFGRATNLAALICVALPGRGKSRNVDPRM